MFHIYYYYYHHHHVSENIINYSKNIYIIIHIYIIINSSIFLKWSVFSFSRLNVLICLTRADVMDKLRLTWKQQLSDRGRNEACVSDVCGHQRPAGQQGSDTNSRRSWSWQLLSRPLTHNAPVLKAFRSQCTFCRLLNETAT